MRPLRFCMLTTFYPPWSFGGDAVQVRRLARALAAGGHEVTVVHSREGYRAVAREDPSPGSNDPGVRVVGIDAGLGVASPLATYLTGRPLLARRQLERALAGRFDVLHFHNPSLLGGPAVLRMGQGGVRLATLHEQWLVCPTHVLFKYRRRVCERPTCWRCTLVHGRPPQPWRSGALLDDAVGGLDALVAPTATSAALHARYADRVRIARLGHFLAPPPPAGGDGHREPAPYFLYVGRLEPVKGVESLVATVARTPRHRLLVAGAGSREAALRRAVAGLPNVELLGWCDEARLDALYRGATALVVPTRGHEAFPLVLLEAFVRGVPVLARSFGALGELAAESGGALTYATEAELHAGLDRLAADAGLRAALAARGRAAWEERWTPEAHLRAYFDLIAQLADARGERELAAAAAAAAP